MNPITTKSDSAAILSVIMVPIIFLIPFATKAFHIDDTLFLWISKQILIHPFDFYGFTANWYGYEMPMSAINKNPPLISYYLAAYARLFGWNEPVFHVAMIIPAVFVSLGTYFLARRFSSIPHLSAMIAILTPGFLVSATNVMSDIMMLAFYVWAIVFWIRGLEESSTIRLFTAAILISLSALSKYFGISLVPLLAVYAIAAKHRPARWILFIIIPLLIMAGYEWFTYKVYGIGLFGDAASYAVQTGQPGSGMFFSKTLTALAFTGGCLASAAFYAPFLWSGKIQIAGLMIPAIIIALLLNLKSIGVLELHDGSAIRWGILIQFAIFISAGIHIFAIALADLKKHKDALSMLLFLWISGTFLFAGFLNWTINARTILPMAPAVGILVSRRYEMTMQPNALKNPILPLTLAAFLALAVTYADFSLAECQRAAARSVHAEFEKYPHRIRFQGHWGFQYYMESIGAEAIDYRKTVPKPGDMIVIPSNNSNTMRLPDNIFRLLKKEQCYPCRWLTTMGFSSGAGFYTDLWGAMPFAFGEVKSEEYHIFVMPKP